MGLPPPARMAQASFSILLPAESISKQRLYEALSDRLKGVPPPVY